MRKLGAIGAAGPPNSRGPVEFLLQSPASLGPARRSQATKQAVNVINWSEQKANIEKINELQVVQTIVCCCCLAAATSLSASLNCCSSALACWPAVGVVVGGEFIGLIK